LTSFSHSKIGSFQKCPRAYEYRYVLKERERFSTIERHMGTSVHEVLHWLYAQRQTGQHPSRQQVEQRYTDQWNTPGLDGSIVVKSGLGQDDYQRDGRRMVLGYFDDAFQRDDSDTLLLEQSFKIPLSDEIRFTGIIDRVARTAGGGLRITDYKTGSRVTDPMSDPQLAYYALYVFDVQPDDEVELAFEDLRNRKSLTATLHREQAANYVRRLMRDIGSIESAVGYAPNPSALCRWCGYNPICDAAEGRTPGVAPEGSRRTEGSRSCPRCGSHLRERSGRHGRFVGCTGFPECRYTRDAW
jgi:putative RecB family exonuclease